MWSGGLERWNKNNASKETHHIRSCEEMILFGKTFGKRLRRPAIVALVGDLGAGKTTLAKGVISGLCAISLSSITSPTFQYVHFYSGNDAEVAHFDLWRLRDEHEFLSLGLEEYLSSGIALIEWPDRIRTLLPASTIFVETRVCGTGREVSIYPPPMKEFSK
jgi:tRNA threonylcarbamoyladenosine biosynthesis protein TsaE